MRFLILLTLATIVIMSCSNVESHIITNNVELQTREKIELNYLVGYFIQVDSINYMTSVFDKKILAYDESFNLMKQAGSHGKGPLEFEYISGFKYFDPFFYIYDFRQWRLTILNTDLEFKSSHNLRSAVITDFSKKDDCIYFFRTARRSEENFSFSDKYLYLGDDLTSLGESILINNKHSGDMGKFRSTDSWQYASLSNNGKLLIVSNYMKDLIVYDTDNESYKIVELDIKDYVSPVRAAKINKKYFPELHKKGFTEPQTILFSFVPSIFLYLENQKIYIIQYLLPYQISRLNDFKYTNLLLVLDENYHTIGQTYINENVIGKYSKNSEDFIVTKRASNPYSEEDNHDDDFNICFKKIGVAKL